MTSFNKKFVFKIPTNIQSRVSSHTPSFTTWILSRSHSAAEWDDSSQWEQFAPARSFLGLAQPIGGGLLVHLTLFLAKESQSQML